MTSRRFSMGLSILFQDPINNQKIENAMITTCGHSFSEETIKQHLKKSTECPVCSHPLCMADLTYNYKLQEAIVQYGEYIKSLEDEEKTKKKQQKKDKKAKKAKRAQKKKSKTTAAAVQAATSCKNKQKKKKTSRSSSTTSESDSTTAASIPPLLHQSSSDSVDPICCPEPRLLIELVKLTGIQRLSRFIRSNSNFYCIIKVSSRLQNSSCSRNIMLDNVWNESFLFSLGGSASTFLTGATPDSEIVEIDFYNKSVVSKDRFVGTIKLTAKDINESRKRNDKVERELDLQKKNVKDSRPVSGKVYLNFRYLDLNYLSNGSWNEVVRGSNGVVAANNNNNNNVETASVIVQRKGKKRKGKEKEEEENRRISIS